MGDYMAQDIPAAILNPLSEEWNRVNCDMDNTAQFLLAACLESPGMAGTASRSPSRQAISTKLVAKEPVAACRITCYLGATSKR